MSEETDRTLILTVVVITVLVIIYVLWRFLQQTRLRLVHLGSGTMTTDGTEQIVFSFDRAQPFIIDGYIDLSNMKAGDTTVIRQYVKLKPGGELRKYGEEAYFGAQQLPVIYIKPKTAIYGVQITLQQKEGSPFSFDWEFHMLAESA